MLDDLVITMQDDFSKYKKRINTLRLKDVFLSVMNQGGGKFNIHASSNSGNHEQKKEALGMLEMAGLCYKVHHSSANGIPLAAEKNTKNFKVLFFDTGLLQRFLQVNIARLLLANDTNTINKGNLTEQFVGVEMIKHLFSGQHPDLYYWQREKRGSCAEVDYLMQFNNHIIPIEVKSGTQGKMQSLNRFIESKKAAYGIRVSMENFAQYHNIRVFPVYAVDNILLNPLTMV